jgi:hypothetical protein
MFTAVHLGRTVQKRMRAEVWVEANSLTPTRLCSDRLDLLILLGALGYLGFSHHRRAVKKELPRQIRANPYDTFSQLILGPNHWLEGRIEDEIAAIAARGSDQCATRSCAASLNSPMQVVA